MKFAADNKAYEKKSIEIIIMTIMAIMTIMTIL